MTRKIKAVGYCRTSGEGQRNNTSIPTQKDEIETFCKRKDYEFCGHYVDESKSGGKVEGRDSFNQMVTDAIEGKFNIIVFYDTTRFGRDAADILLISKKLAQCDVYCESTDGRYDARPGNARLNAMEAGDAEDERFRIAKRTFKGRIAKAKQGKPWGREPFGRSYDKTTGKWHVNEQGKNFVEFLKRYVEGEKTIDLCKELGFDPESCLRRFHICQPAGRPYEVSFESKVLRKSEVVPVPQIPPLITKALEQKVIQKCKNNQSFSPTGKRKYRLSGFVKCGHCGAFLTGQTCRKHFYYRSECEHKMSIPGKTLERCVLEFLYDTFLDEPAYKKAIEEELPSDEDRKNLENEIEELKKRAVTIQRQLDELFKSFFKDKEDDAPERIKRGMKDLEANQKVVEDRLATLQTKLEMLPDPDEVLKRVDEILIEKFDENFQRDWSGLSVEEIREFLEFHFGPSSRKSPFGIFVTRIEDDEDRQNYCIAIDEQAWELEFKGRFDDKELLQEYFERKVDHHLSGPSYFQKVVPRGRGWK